MIKLSIIAHNIRSIHNVGSLLRTADGLGVEQIYFTGYTPYPRKDNDQRLPHLADKINRQIHKTALGAEESVKWQQSDDLEPILKQLNQSGYRLVGLEQDGRSLPLNSFQPSHDDKIALLIGSEVNGIDKELLDRCQLLLEIPMKGAKESFNVVEATTMAIYQILCVSSEQ